MSLFKSFDTNSYAPIIYKDWFTFKNKLFDYCNVCSSGDSFKLEIPFPGIPKEDISVKVSEKKLTISTKSNNYKFEYLNYNNLY
jgi:HSP20 family molecular chaperone IbpA